MMLNRAHLASVVGSLAGPLILSVAAATIGWWYGTLVPVPFVLALAFVTPGSPARDQPVEAGTREPPLSRAFWLSWLFLALCIGAEFSYVVWGAQVVSARTGISTEAATGLASAFVAGMVGGRLVASTMHLDPRRQLAVLRLGTALTLIGALVTWAAAAPQLAALGLLLGGLGMSSIYPYGASLALAHAWDAPVRASARLTLASSSSIFAAPLVLGLVAGSAGIVGAWVILVVLLVVALILVLRVGAPATGVDHVDALTA
jgi:fucose permease